MGNNPSDMLLILIKYLYENKLGVVVRKQLAANRFVRE